MSTPAPRTPPEGLRIIDAQPDHETAIRLLSDETHRIHRARLPHVFGPENSYQDWLIARYFTDAPLPKTTFCNHLRVACDADHLLGYIMLVWDTAEPPVSAVIADIAVSPQGQRRGIAQALIQDADGLRATYGWHSLTADVWVGNDASHALFTGAGFVPERTEYRLGLPPALEQSAPFVPQRKAAHLWWIAAAVIIAITLVASVP